MRLENPNISAQVELEDGSRIVLLGMLSAGPESSDKEIDCNIYRVRLDGEVMWQIDAAPGIYDRSPFTGLWLDGDGRLCAYRWDGVDYTVDLETGAATPVRLSR